MAKIFWLLKAAIQHSTWACSLVKWWFCLSIRWVRCADLLPSLSSRSGSLGLSSLRPRSLQCSIVDCMGVGRLLLVRMASVSRGGSLRVPPHRDEWCKSDRSCSPLVPSLFISQFYIYCASAPPTCWGESIMAWLPAPSEGRVGRVLVGASVACYILVTDVGQRIHIDEFKFGCLWDRSKQ